MEERQDIVDQDMVVFTPDESKEEPFNTAIENTSDNPTIVMANWLPLHLSQMMYAFQWRR